MAPNELEKELLDIKRQLHHLNQVVQNFDRKINPSASPTVPLQPPTPPPAGIPIAVASEKKKVDRAAQSLESFFGARWMVVIGVVAIILAVGFELRAALAKGWITEEVRCAMAIVLGFGLFSAGAYCRRRYARYGEVLMSGGVVSFFLGIYAAHALYGLIDGPKSMLLLLTLGWGSAFLCNRCNARTPIYIGLIGCYLAPFLVSDLKSNPTSIFLFLMILNSSYLILAWAIRDLSLQMTALYLASGVYFLAWYGHFHQPAGHWTQAFAYQLLQAVTFAAASLAPAVFRREGLSVERTWGLFPALMLFYYFSSDLLLQHAPHLHVWLGLGAVILVFGFSQLGRQRLGEALPEHAPSVMSALFGLLVTLHLAHKSFAGELRTWVMFGLFYVALYIWHCFHRSLILGIFIGLQSLWLAILLHFDFGYGHAIERMPFLNQQFFLAATFSATLLFFPRSKDSDEVNYALDFFGHSLMLHLLYLQIYLKIGVTHATFKVTLLWILYAGLILGLGFWRKSHRLRTSALWLFGLCTAKVFLYDTLSSSTAVKVNSYLLLGVALIVGGYFYQKLRPKI